MIGLFVAASFLLAYMFAAMAVALAVRNNGVADIAYGGGFILTAWITYAYGTHTPAGFLASALVTLWGIRLIIRLLLRALGKPEDFRYKHMRDTWGNAFIFRTFFQIFLLQGIVIFIVSLPVTLLNTYDTSWTIPLIAYLGVIVWFKGFFFETVGDHQLDAFRKKPENAGHVLSTGLWKYTRHPNYYGEALMWWGIALTALLTLGLVYGYGDIIAYACAASPLLITFLLLKVSGVPLLEAHFSGPEWEAYKARTSVFIPWFPKRT